jgi:Rps23 Pro-64 3,4-dihydroxylase Tpa1-like proline 4-hydroxylase
MPNNQKYLKLIANECASKIQNAVHSDEYFDSPFKHLVLDNFLPTELAEQCLEYFPDIDGGEWEHEDVQDIEVKYRTTWKSEFDIPDGLVNAIRVMNSAPILRAMSYLFSIPKLMPDPYFTGGGLNVTKKGGLLDVHVDGNYHDASGLHRRLNALIYLNKDWIPDWGG